MYQVSPSLSLCVCFNLTEVFLWKIESFTILERDSIENKGEESNRRSGGVRKPRQVTRVGGREKERERMARASVIEALNFSFATLRATTTPFSHSNAPLKAASLRSSNCTVVVVNNLSSSQILSSSNQIFSTFRTFLLSYIRLNWLPIVLVSLREGERLKRLKKLSFISFFLELVSKTSRVQQAVDENFIAIILIECNRDFKREEY